MLVSHAGQLNNCGNTSKTMFTITVKLDLFAFHPHIHPPRNVYQVQHLLNWTETYYMPILNTRSWEHSIIT